MPRAIWLLLFVGFMAWLRRDWWRDGKEPMEAKLRRFALGVLVVLGIAALLHALFPSSGGSWEWNHKFGPERVD